MIDASTNTYAILTDTTKCTGCEKCVAACKKINQLGEDRPERWKATIDDLSSTRFTTVMRRPGAHFVRRQCRHCLEPACVSACIVGALKKQPEGPVTYDAGRCMGCRYCMVACPFGIPRYEWERAAPKIRKCTMCFERLKDGKQPGCTEACPEGATIFGPREELLAEAKRRVASDGKYGKMIYGEKEVGGTSVIYVSDIPLGFLAWKPELDDKPLPDRTWAALSEVPWVAGGGGLGMLGVWWVIGRRMSLQAQAIAESAAAEGAAPAESSESQKKDSEK